MKLFKVYQMKVTLMVLLREILVISSIYLSRPSLHSSLTGNDYLAHLQMFATSTSSRCLTALKGSSVRAYLSPKRRMPIELSYFWHHSAYHHGHGRGQSSVNNTSVDSTFTSLKVSDRQ